METKPMTSNESTLDILESSKTWPTWKLLFKELLKKKSLLKVVEGKERLPGPLQLNHCGHQISNYYNRFNIIDRDDQAQQYIKDFVSPVVYKMIMDMYPDIYLRTSSDMWIKLIDLFEEMRIGDRHLRLMTSFFENQKFDIENEMGLEMLQLEWLWNELNFEARKLNIPELPEYVYISRLVTCLPKEFEEMKLDWEGFPSHKRTLEKLNKMIHNILNRYLRKRKMKDYGEEEDLEEEEEEDEDYDEEEEEAESYLDES